MRAICHILGALGSLNTFPMVVDLCCRFRYRVVLFARMPVAVAVQTVTFPDVVETSWTFLAQACSGAYTS